MATTQGPRSCAQSFSAMMDVLGPMSCRPKTIKDTSIESVVRDLRQAGEVMLGSSPTLRTVMAKDTEYPALPGDGLVWTCVQIQGMPKYPLFTQWRKRIPSETWKNMQLWCLRMIPAIHTARDAEIFLWRKIWVARRLRNAIQARLDTWKRTHKLLVKHRQKQVMKKFTDEKAKQKKISQTKLWRVVFLAPKKRIVQAPRMEFPRSEWQIGSKDFEGAEPLYNWIAKAREELGMAPIALRCVGLRGMERPTTFEIMQQKLQNEDWKDLMEAQADCERVPAKSHLKFKNICNNLITALRRHYEKMLVLCKRGRYKQNMGVPDMQLWRRQRVALTNAIKAFWDQIFGAGLPFKFGSAQDFNLPDMYDQEVKWVIDKIEVNLRHLDFDEDPGAFVVAFTRITGMVSRLHQNWLESTYEPRKCGEICQATEDQEAQACVRRVPNIERLLEDMMLQEVLPELPAEDEVIPGDDGDNLVIHNPNGSEYGESEQEETSYESSSSSEDEPEPDMLFRMNSTHTWNQVSPGHWQVINRHTNVVVHHFHPTYRFTGLEMQDAVIAYAHHNGLDWVNSTIPFQHIHIIGRCDCMPQASGGQEPQSNEQPLQSSGGGGGTSSTTSSAGKAAEPVQKPVKKAETDVTTQFVDQRPVQKSRPEQVKTDDKKGDAISEIQYKLSDLAQKYQLVDKFDWKVSDNGQIRQYMIPQIYFSSTAKPPIACQPFTAQYLLSMFGFGRFGVKFKIQTNTTKFQQGLLLLVFVPHFFKERDNDIMNNYMQYAHTFVDAASSNSVEFSINWRNYRDFFPLYTDPNSEYNYFGVLRIIVFNNLMTGENTSQNATITVYCALENLDVHQMSAPRDISTISFPTNIRAIDWPLPYGKVSGEMRMHADIVVPSVYKTYEAQALESVVSSVVPMAVDLGTNLVEGLLHSVTRVSNDKPSTAGVMMPVVPRICANLAPGDGMDLSQRLSLHSVGATPPDSSFVRPHNFKQLLKQWSRFQVVSFKISDLPNAELATWAVMPMLSDISANRENTFAASCVEFVGTSEKETSFNWTRGDRKPHVRINMVRPTMLAYMAWAFNWWRGTLKFKLQVVATGMHSGRLVIRYEPGGIKKSAIMECSKLAQPVVIWDIQEKHEIEIDAPFMSTQPWLSTKYFNDQAAIDVDGISRFTCGVMQLTVLNELKRTTGVASSVDINLYVSAGDDFELNYPSDLHEILSVGCPITSYMNASGTKYWMYGKWLRYFLFEPWFNTKTVFRHSKNKDGSINSYPLPFAYLEAEKQEAEKLMEGLVAAQKFATASVADGKLLQDVSIYQIPDTLEDSLQQLHAWGVLEPVTDIKSKRYNLWLAIAHMRSKAFNILHIPKYTGLVPTTTFYGWEAQSNEIAKGKAINPFVGGTSVPVADIRRVFGESDMDMHKVLRRYYFLGEVQMPYAKLGKDYLQVDDAISKLYQQIASRADEREMGDLLLRIRIPVTPMVQPMPFGLGTSMVAAKGIQTKDNFCYPEWNKAFGLDGKDQSCITQLTWWTWLYTWWRGSMRYKMVFPEGFANLGEFVTVVYQPHDFANNGPRPYTVALSTKAWMMKAMNQGAVLYTNTVQGAIEVEIPYRSKYARLHLSPNCKDATCTAGSVNVYVTLNRLAANLDDRYNSEKVYKDDSVLKEPLRIPRWRVMLFAAGGEDLELTDQRAAPPVWVGNNYLYTPDNPNNKEWSLLMGNEGDAGQVNPCEPLGEIRKAVEISQIGSSVKPIFHSPGVVRCVDPVVVTGSVGKYRKLMQEFDNYNFPYVKPVTPEAASEGQEPQANEEPLDACGDMQRAEAVADDVVDGALAAMKAAPALVKDLSTALGAVTQTAASLSEVSKKLDPAITAVKTGMDKMSGVSDFVKAGASYGLNAIRIGIFASSVYSILQAETWSGRWLHIAAAAMAVGLDPALIGRAGEWVMSSLGSLFSPKKDHEEKQVPQAGEAADETWMEFIDRNIDVLRMTAASVFALAAFYFSSDAPPIKQVTSFTDRMIRKLKSFTIIGAAFKTFDWLFSWVSKMIMAAFEWAVDFSTGGMYTLKSLTNKYPEIVEWLRKIEHYKNDEYIKSAVWNPDARFELWNLIDQGNQFRNEIGQKSGFLANAITRGACQLTVAHDKIKQVRAVAPARIDPWLVWLEGPSGVGKSAILNTIIDHVCNHLKLPEAYRTYNRAEKDDYWSGYVGQPAVIIDDLCQWTKGQVVHEIINIKSNTLYPVPMAAVEDKGRMFSSLIVGVTSNQAYPKPTEMANPEALFRRRNVLVRVTNTGQGFAHMTFQLLNAIPTSSDVEANKIGEPMNAEQFMVYCAVNAEKYIQDQKALVLSLMRGRRIPVTDNMDDPPKVARLRQFLKSLPIEAEKTTMHQHQQMQEMSDSDWWVCIRVLTADLARVVGNKHIEKILRAFETQGPVAPEQSCSKDRHEVQTLESENEVFRAVCEKLHEDARTVLNRHCDMYTFFKMYLNEVKQTEQKYKVVANKEEVAKVVQALFPDDPKQEEMVNDIERIFEEVNTDKQALPPKARPVEAQHLLELYNKKWWKEDKGKWTFNLCEEQLSTDEEFNVYSAYQVLQETMTPEEISSMMKERFNPVTRFGVKTLSVVERWGKAQVEKVKNFFNEHPWILGTMKLVGIVAGLCATWKVFEYFVPGIAEKIRVTLGNVFGIGACGMGIGSVRSACSTVAKGFHDRTSGAIDTIRGWMSRSQDPEIRNMVSEANTVELMATEVEKLLPAVKTAVAAKQLRISEAMTKFNPYHAGDTRKHVPQSKIEYASLDEKHRAQGAQDPNAAAIREHVVIPNMVRLMYYPEEMCVRSNAGIFIRSRTLLAPWHFFDGMTNGDYFYVTKDGMRFIEVFYEERCRRVKQLDAAVYECHMRMPQHKNLIKHFVTKDTMPERKTSATLTIKHETGTCSSWLLDAVLVADVSYELPSGTQMTNALGWEYTSVTNKGDCGAVLMADNPALPKKILGIHVSGIPNKNIGSSCLLFAEDLEEVCRGLNPESDCVSDPSQFVPQSFIIPDSVEKMKIRPSEQFELLGAVKSKFEVRLPHKSEIIPSPLFDLVRKHVTEPAVLHANDERYLADEDGKKESVVLKAINKYALITQPYMKEMIEEVSKDLRAEMKEWRVSEVGKRLLTDHEAVFGNEYVEYFDRMNMAASAGFPYTTSRPSGKMGKEWLYDIDSPDGIGNKEYRVIYQVREQLAQKGRRTISVWTDCLKDERRPLEKIRQGKTRVFMLPPADFVQLCRKYFLAFCITFYQNHNESWSAVGMDPYSYEWTKLYRYLKSNSNLAFGGDFHAFDGILDPNILFQICEDINDWYDDSDVNKRVRRVLFEEIIHTVHICLNSVYIDHQGNPSGNPATVVINTLAHLYYLRLSWLEITKMMAPSYYGMVQFHKNVREKYYGDDGLYTVKYNASRFFHQLSVASCLKAHGIEYTDESKAGVERAVRSITDCRFLKNGFAKMPGNPDIMLAPISQDTIWELTNWVKKSEDDYAQLRCNLEDLFKFAFHWGPEEYGRIERAVNNALEARKLKRFETTWQAEKVKFLANVY